MCWGTLLIVPLTVEYCWHLLGKGMTNVLQCIGTTQHKEILSTDLLLMDHTKLPQNTPDLNTVLAQTFLGISPLITFFPRASYVSEIVVGPEREKIHKALPHPHLLSWIRSSRPQPRSWGLSGQPQETFMLHLIQPHAIKQSLGAVDHHPTNLSLFMAS